VREEVVQTFVIQLLFLGLINAREKGNGMGTKQQGGGNGIPVICGGIQDLFRRVSKPPNWGKWFKWSLMVIDSNPNSVMG